MQQISGWMVLTTIPRPLTPLTPTKILADVTQRANAGFKRAAGSSARRAAARVAMIAAERTSGHARVSTRPSKGGAPTPGAWQNSPPYGGPRRRVCRLICPVRFDPRLATLLQRSTPTYNSCSLTFDAFAPTGRSIQRGSAGGATAIDCARVVRGRDRRARTALSAGRAT